MSTQGTVRVAAVQAAPVWLDAAASTDKAVELIGRAAQAGADLVAFGESWLPGYPFWIWTGPPAAGVPHFLRYHANAVTVDGPELTAIRGAARQGGIHVVLGAAERSGGSLYASQFVIDDTGDLIARRRKLKPTHVERSVWGEGDGTDLRVVQTRLGTLGALNCWEHIQPLNRFALYSMGEQIHVASWPAFGVYRQAAPELSGLAARHVNASYALEGQCFVVAASSVIPPELVELLDPQGMGLLVPGGGGAMVVAPNTTVLAEAAGEEAEELVVADCDLSTIPLAKMTADPAGHYARGDVTRLWLNTAPRPAVQIRDAGPEPTFDTDRAVLVADGRTA